MRITTAPARDRVNLAEVDLFGPDLYADGDPHSVWAAMRAEAPLHRQTLPDGRSFLSVTRFRDACRVLGDSAAFTSERGSLLEQLGHGDAAAGKMLVSTDPPRHTELRRPLHRVLSARALAPWKVPLRAAARSMLEPGLDGGVWDLAAAAAMFPMTFTGALMGFPERDWPDLVRWTSMAAAPRDPRHMLRNPGATLAIAHHELFSYFGAEAKRRIAEGRRDDLVGLLTTMTAEDEPLDHADTVFNCYSLLLGANATTPHAVAGTVLALIEHPAQWSAVGADPGLVPSLVEEGLRWTSPANGFLRHATEDVELSGGTVRRGEAVAVWIGSANRDETVFPDPYRFDVTRTGNRHIAFGFGPHYCLGATLAKMALGALFAEIVDRVARFELAGAIQHTRSNFVAGISALPLRLHPR